MTTKEYCKAMERLTASSTFDLHVFMRQEHLRSKLLGSNKDIMWVEIDGVIHKVVGGKVATE